MATKRLKQKCEMVCFTGETMAEALRAAADHVENFERAIYDIVIGHSNDDQPMVTIYQERKR